jgi:hypothetical protein
MCFIYLLIVRVYKGVQILVIKGFNRGASLKGVHGAQYTLKHLANQMELDGISF